MAKENTSGEEEQQGKEWLVKKDILSEKKKDIEEYTDKELITTISKTPRELTDISIATLYEKYGILCDIEREKWIMRYHINKKWFPIEGGLWQMVITIIQSGLMRIRLNVSWSKNEYYIIEWLSNDDFLGETDTIMAFLFDGVLPSSTSKIKKANTIGDFSKKYIEKSSPSVPTVSKSPKDVQETLDKTPKLTKEYYKIPSLSEDQKKIMKLGETIDGWTKEEIISYIDNKKYTSIIITKSIPGKEVGYIRECIDSIPEKFKGVQFFTAAAASNLWLNDSLPIRSSLVKIKWKKQAGHSDVVYNKNNELIVQFIENNNLLNAGMYSANTNALSYVDSFRYHLLLKDGQNLAIDANDDDINQWEIGLNKNHGYPIMLMKK